MDFGLITQGSFSLPRSAPQSQLGSATLTQQYPRLVFPHEGVLMSQLFH